MTMTADTAFNDAPIFNPLQVVAMDGVISVGLITALKIGGMGWGLAFLGGWLGGAVLTMGLLFGVAYVCLQPKSVRTEHKSYKEALAQQGSPLVPASVTNTMAAWDEDLAIERAHWLRIAQRRKSQRICRRTTTKMAFKMWDDDMAADRKSALQLRRPVRLDRRQAELAAPGGVERREAQR